ncbi:MAG: ribosome silencing factor [Spirochaetia bacterium]|nr:ribosome silencing factor [Spirochaetia bacterium]
MENLKSSETKQILVDSEDFSKIRFEICKSLDLNKSEDILMLNLKQHFKYDIWFIIATSLSNTHLRKCVQDIVFFLKKQGIYSSHVPNDLDFESGWVALDYGEIIVHVFTKEKREFYNLEGLWSNALVESFP